MQQQTTKSFDEIDKKMMRRALLLAKRGLGHTNPNPMVGCVITRDNKIIGEGWHSKIGAPHAEIEAINSCHEATGGATIYITLTPCHHHGRTGPCTQAIVDAGFARVVIAADDPNPKTQQSVQWLREQGVHVDTGCLADDAAALNPIFNHVIQHHSMYVHAKWAMSLDGKMQTHSKTDRHISHPDNQQQAHYWRQYCDAILVGVNTVINDNPSLTTRHPFENVKARHPLRIILDTNGRTPLSSFVLSSDISGKTLIVCNNTVSKNWIQGVKDQGHAIYQSSIDADGRLCLRSLFNYLYQQGITSILIEGGQTVRDYCIDKQLIHSVDVYIAPCFIGSKPESKQRINLTSCTQTHGDFLISCQT